jgi:hypothetical protein
MPRSGKNQDHRVTNTMRPGDGQQIMITDALLARKIRIRAISSIFRELNAHI